MKDWELLTEVGQIRRLRPLAFAALDEFGVTPRRLSLIGGFTNVLFRVDTDDGPLALRVDLHQDHSDRDVEIELAWLAALNTETSLDVVQSVQTRDGAPFTNVGVTGVPGDRRATLFRWVPGRPIGDDPTSGRWRQLGELSAKLHLHGEGFVPPAMPMRWDRVFYWPEEVDPVVIDKADMAHHLCGGRREVLQTALAATEEAFAALKSAPAQILHGDLHPGNVHFHRKRLIALDFEDVMWGHRVQDVATSLFYFADDERYGSFRRAFEAGYRDIADWPESYEGEIDHFIAARTMMLINYMANVSADPSEYYSVWFRRLEDFLQRWVT